MLIEISVFLILFENEKSNYDHRYMLPNSLLSQILFYGSTTYKFDCSKLYPIDTIQIVDNSTSAPVTLIDKYFGIVHFESPGHLVQVDLLFFFLLT